MKGDARRRLQSVRSTSTTGISRAPFRRAPRSCPRGAASWVARPLSGPDQPSSFGSGIRYGFRRLGHPPDVIAHTEVGYPDPRGPDTFCREPVMETAGGAAPSGAHEAHPLRAHRASPLARDPPPASCLRGTLRQGQILRSPAKGRAITGPKVPSIVGGSPEGWGQLGKPSSTHDLREGWAIVHRLLPACGDFAGASSTPAVGACFDKACSWQGLGP